MVVAEPRVLLAFFSLIPQARKSNWAPAGISCNAEEQDTFCPDSLHSGQHVFEERKQDKDGKSRSAASCWNVRQRYLSLWHMHFDLFSNLCSGPAQHLVMSCHIWHN